MNYRYRATTGLELVLCACENELKMVLTNDEELVVSQSWVMAHRGTEILAPALQQMFTLTGWKIDNLRRIGCVCGPGSFTGIRLVLATAAALRRSTRAQLAALNYLQALATSVSMAEGLQYGHKIWVFTHARRGIVNACCFRSYGPVIPSYPLNEAVLLSSKEALYCIQHETCGEGRLVFVCGSALKREQELRAGLDELERGNICVQRPCVTSPSTEALRLLGRHGDYFPRDVEPMYLRPCDAVENLSACARKMGCDAEVSSRKFTRLIERSPQSSI